jgi:hypothetical protein
VSDLRGQPPQTAEAIELLQLPLQPPPVRDVGSADDDSADERMTEQIRSVKVEQPPRSVLVAETDLGAIDVSAAGENLQQRPGAFLVVRMNVLERTSAEALAGFVAEDLLDGRADVFEGAVSADDENEIGNVVGENAEVVVMLLAGEVAHLDQSRQKPPDRDQQLPAAIAQRLNAIAAHDTQSSPQPSLGIDDAGRHGERRFLFQRRGLVVGDGWPAVEPGNGEVHIQPLGGEVQEIADGLLEEVFVSGPGERSG